MKYQINWKVRIQTKDGSKQNVHYSITKLEAQAYAKKLREAKKYKSVRVIKVN